MGNTTEQEPSLQQQAVEKARLAFSRLPDGDALFRQCVRQESPVVELLATVKKEYDCHRKKRTSRSLEKFQQYTAWLQNFSDVVDVAVQTQAGIACPIWAPIKFVLQVSKYHSEVTEEIFSLIETIIDNFSRLEIYKKLNTEPALQICLVNIFTDVIEFIVHIFQTLQKGTIGFLWKVMATSFRKELKNITLRLQTHLRDADSAAVATELLKMAQFRNEQRLKDREEMKLRCFAWLKAPNMKRIFHDRVQEKLFGTCKWVWTQEPFMKWQSSSDKSSAADRLLCISGAHGCGKSVLAASIADVLITKDKWVFFFSFSGTESNRQTIESLTRSLLLQLLQKADRDDIFDLLRKFMAQGEPLLTELWNIFITALETISESIYCIIDGIDECETPLQDLFSQMNHLLAVRENFRTLFLGRPHSIHPVQQNYPTIKIDPALIEADINEYINEQIDSCVKLQSDATRNLAFKTLKSGSHGMFLWVKLMVNDLSKSSSKAEVTERLHSLPHGLQKAYRCILGRMVQNLDSIDIRFARHALAFIVTARRPLKIEELRYAQGLKSWLEAGRPSHIPFMEYMSDDVVSKALTVCGSLLDISNDTVRLVHLSAKEFLTRPEAEWISLDDQRIASLRIDLDESHYSFSHICLSYLGQDNYGLPLQNPKGLSTIWTDHPLLQYASRNVIYHFNRAGKHLVDLTETINQFANSERCLSWIEYFSIHFLEDDSTGYELEECIAFLSYFEDHRSRDDLQSRVKALMEQELNNLRCQFAIDSSPPDQVQESIIMSSVPGAREPIASVSHGSTILASGTSSDMSSMSRMVEMIKNQGSLTGPRQVELFFRIMNNLHRLKRLTDPLELLFQLFLRFSGKMSVYTLLAVSGFYTTCGKPEKALQLCHMAAEQVNGRDVPVEFRVWMTIGHLYQATSRYSEAENAWRRAVEGWSRLFGPDHRDTLSAIHSLGRTLYQQEKYLEAEQMYRRALEGRKKILGPNHPKTLCIVYNLALDLHCQSKHHEAEQMYRRALEGRQKVLGPDHKYTLDTVRGLATDLFSQEKYVEAEEMYRRALGGMEKALGPDHQRTLETVFSLALDLFLQERYNEAEEMHRKALKGREKVLGPDHQHTLDTVYGLALNLDYQKKYDEAEEMHRRALKGREKVLGPDHPKTLDTVQNLALYLHCQKRYYEAEDMDRRALKGRERVLGQDHKHTLLSVQAIALDLYYQQRYDEAEEMYLRVLRGREKVLGPNHQETLDIVQSLAINLYCQKRYDEAEEMNQRVLEGRQMALDTPP